MSHTFTIRQLELLHGQRRIGRMWHRTTIPWTLGIGRALQPPRPHQRDSGERIRLPAHYHRTQYFHRHTVRVACVQLLEDRGLVGAAQLDDGDGVPSAARGVFVIVILLELGIRVVDDDESGARAQGVLEGASARFMRRAQLAPVESQPVNASVLCSLI